MTDTPHDTIVIERPFAVPVSRLFAAWADTQALERWCCPGDDGWSGAAEAHDFRVGGSKRISFGPEGEVPYIEDSRYVDIVPDARIINTETILKGDARISASIITLEFAETGAGSTLTVTDQITLVDDSDSPEGRRGGWGEVLDKLTADLAENLAA